jgi:hypothetical protein
MQKLSSRDVGLEDAFLDRYETAFQIFSIDYEEQRLTFEDLVERFISTNQLEFDLFEIEYLEDKLVDAYVNEHKESA